MNRMPALTHKFVEYIPDNLIDGTVYVSIAFATVAHKCCCGCGNEVITPLSPTDWKLIFNGESISLYPSIGNWSFPCKSHYWIENNKVSWAPRWSREKIDTGRANDSLAKEKYFDTTKSPALRDTLAGNGRTEEDTTKESVWRRLKKRLFH